VTAKTPLVSSVKAITAYSFPSLGVTGTIGERGISVSVPSGTNVTALLASFTNTGAKVKVGSTGRQASGMTANNFSEPVTYYVYPEDGSQPAPCVVSANLAPPAITAFSFPGLGVTGTITQSANGGGISVSVPGGTNVTALVAGFATTGASVKVGSTVQVSGVTVNDFTGLVIYTVTAADGSTASYTVTVTFLRLGPSSARIDAVMSISNCYNRNDDLLEAECVAVIDQGTKTIHLVFPSLLPSYGWVVEEQVWTTGAVSLRIGSEAYTVDGFGEATPNFYTSGTVYSVTASDGPTVDYLVD
jgi:hypothetical protein